MGGLAKERFEMDFRCGTQLREWISQSHVI